MAASPFRATKSWKIVPLPYQLAADSVMMTTFLAPVSTM
jgi:hypothetical protein